MWVGALCIHACVFVKACESVFTEGMRADVWMLFLSSLVRCNVCKSVHLCSPRLGLCYLAACVSLQQPVG